MIGILLAQTPARVSYQLGRLDALDQWWHWMVFALVGVLIVSHVVFWYRKDWIEIPRALGWCLLVLRLTALLGILVFFLDLQKRSEQRITRHSRVAILVDTSLSMSLPQETSGANSDAASRIASVHEAMRNNPWLEQLQKNHDTTVYRFDQNSRPASIASFPKPKNREATSDVDQESTYRSVWQSTSRVAWLGTVLGSVGLGGLFLALTLRIVGRRGDATAYGALLGTVAGIAGLVFVTAAVLRSTPLPWKSLWSSSAPSFADIAVNKSPESEATKTIAPRDIPWTELLVASGAETRLGDAVHAIVEQERGAPLAGIVLITDGENNAGIEPQTSISDAVLGNIPLYAIGLGSSNSPINVRLVDVEAPKRVYPGDRFRVNALVQASGMQGTSTNVQLRRSSADGDATSFTIEEEVVVSLGKDDELVPVHFDVQPQAVGLWIYDVKILVPPQDSNPQDNNLDTQVRVVEPRSQVLVLAGGPTREYQFVRNLLFRDKTVQSHVLLQTGAKGTSQESQKLLEDFPKTLGELAEYDCVVAFDADFMALSLEQVEVLEKWVSEQGGGLVLIVGPLGTPRWAGTEGNGDRRAELLRGLSPVVLNARGTRLVSLGKFESETSWPLKFSEDGMRADFLRLEDSPEKSLQVWQRFGGIYSHYSCYDAKPGATALAYFSDPNMVVDGKSPIFLASHFFGSGRVVFQGTGEMWRLREQSDALFDRYFTKLIRWAGQGRLLRDSDRGMLLLDKEQALVSEQIAVRAVLRDNQFQPLMRSRVDGVLIDPQKRRTPLILLPLQDPTQPGVYTSQFLVKQTGTYTAELAVGGLADQEILSQQVSVRVPAREIQRPQRNDPLLAEMALKTGGKYYVGWQSAIAPNDAGIANIAAQIPSQDQSNFLPGAPDLSFQERLMTMLMALIAGTLCLEWLIRRLSKLA